MIRIPKERKKFIFSRIIAFFSRRIYTFRSFLQGWDYLAFSSPSAPNPVLFLRRHTSGNFFQIPDTQISNLSTRSPPFVSARSCRDSTGWLSRGFSTTTGTRISPRASPASICSGSASAVGGSGRTTWRPVTALPMESPIRCGPVSSPSHRCSPQACRRRSRPHVRLSVSSRRTSSW